MFRAVGTNDGSYVAIGGTNGYTNAPEDPTKQYVHVYVEDNDKAQTVSVQVEYLMEALMTEGFISDYALPEPPPLPLTQVERVAKALMEARELSEYTDDEFRQDMYYAKYMDKAEALLKGDNK